MTALPAESHLLNGRCLGVGANKLRIARAVGLAEGMSAGDESNGLLIVHGHAAERFANVPCRSHGIRLAVRPLRINIDQAHLHGSERILELTVAGVTLVAKPGPLLAPVHGFVGLPHVGTPAAKA